MLFGRIREDPALGIDAVLFKGDGSPADHEVVLRTPRRHGWTCGLLARLRSDHVYWEYLFFTLAFVLRACLVRDRYASVVCIEPMVSKTLRRLKVLIPGRPRITFTHGVWMDPPEYHRNGDCIHEVNVENYERMRAHLAAINAPTELVCIPHFLPEDDGRAGQEAPTRTSLGITTKFVALAVGVIDSDHKRTDHVIREIALLGPEWTLLACGSPKGADGERVAMLGRQVLGPRFVNITLPREMVWKAYAVADFFVLGSLNEGFGLVLLEAMREGLPVIAHDRPIFRWILGRGGTCVAMDTPGSLAGVLGALEADPARVETMREHAKREFKERFTWNRLRHDYARMIVGRRTTVDSSAN